MPLIKPRTRGKQIVRYIARLDRENLEALHAYAEFLGEPPDYVLNQLIDTVLAKDKDFATWRTTHPQSFLPPSVLRLRNSRRNAAQHGAPTPPPRGQTAPTPRVS